MTRDAAIPVYSAINASCYDVCRGDLSRPVLVLCCSEGGQLLAYKVASLERLAKQEEECLQLNLAKLGAAVDGKDMNLNELLLKEEEASSNDPVSPESRVEVQLRTDVHIYTPISELPPSLVHGAQLERNALELPKVLVDDEGLACLSDLNRRMSAVLDSLVLPSTASSQSRPGSTASGAIRA